MSGDRTSPRQFEIIASTRRRWSAEQKRAIVDEIAAAGGSVSEVARRHSVHTSQLFRWRRVQRTERGAQVPLVRIQVGRVGTIRVTRQALSGPSHRSDAGVKSSLLLLPSARSWEAADLHDGRRSRRLLYAFN